MKTRWIILGLLLALFALLAPAMARAQDAPAEPPKFDLAPLLSRLSVCTAVGQRAADLGPKAQGQFLAGGCYAPISWGWGSLNGGVLWKGNGSDSGLGGAMGAVAVRADLACAYVWSKADLERRGVRTHFVVPQLELGPMAAWHERTGWLLGLYLKGSWPSLGSGAPAGGP